MVLRKVKVHLYGMRRPKKTKIQFSNKEIQVDNKHIEKINMIEIIRKTDMQN